MLSPLGMGQGARRDHSGRSGAELGMRWGIGLRGVERGGEDLPLTFLLSWLERPAGPQEALQALGAAIKQ